jgi:cytochrome c-type biogenesis protein CcmH
MNWLPMLLLAGAAFAVAVLVLRLPRGGWTLFGAALLFGLAGYALQGSPGQAGTPKEATPAASESGEALIAARRELFDPTQPPSHFVTIADGFARRGQYDDAAAFLRNAVHENPRDTEAWLALGNALIEHAGGIPTPAALYAYSRAEAARPGHPGAGYFLGIAMLRAERPRETRAIWAELIAGAPADAPWLPAMRERLRQLDALLGIVPAPEAP